MGRSVNIATSNSKTVQHQAKGPLGHVSYG